MVDDRHDVAFLVGAIVGGIAGGAAMLFAAPQSGAATRSDLSSQIAALTERATTLTDQTRDQVRGQLSGVQETAAPYLSRFMNSDDQQPVVETGTSVEFVLEPDEKTGMETVDHRSAADLYPAGAGNATTISEAGGDPDDDTATVAPDPTFQR